MVSNLFLSRPTTHRIHVSERLYLLLTLLISLLSTSSTTAWTAPPHSVPFRGLATTRFSAQHHCPHIPCSLTSNSHDSTTAIQEELFIRDCNYAELGFAADVILKAFYVNATSVWKHLYRMSELSRLQQGFPYAPDRTLHRMIVATLKCPRSGRETIVGFCDIDARRPNRPTSYSINPRPYLSDLCIDPDYRRRGIAKALVKECEDFCVEKLQRDTIYIRVEEKNHAAVTMYQSLGYQPIENPDGGGILLLAKRLAAQVVQAE